ncbi:MAG: nickel pincer cofactor biosynthesis protein LarC [Carbonactinosporaceae bacterium]
MTASATPAAAGPDESRARVSAWFHCFAGASGDMVLGALVDAGAPLATVQAAVDAIGVEPITLTARHATRHGLAATKIDVRVDRSTVIRTWGNVRRILGTADLPQPVRDRALDVFSRLARAEATAHRTSPDQVHFHEVGGLDALADIVGSCAALHALGVTDAVGSAVALGSGMARSEHGLVPVPSPAVVALLSEVRAPTYSGDAPYELCTPTGAALLAATCRTWGGLPPMHITASGMGAGTRELAEMPNVLRVVVGEPVGNPAAGAGEPALLFETNVDDLDPRLWPPVLAKLLGAGASDAWLVPILMKKGRPAQTLAVLVPAGEADAVRRVVFTETSAIGLRETPVTKRALERGLRVVQVDGVEIRVKTATLAGVVVNAQPEYEDVAAAAAQLGRPAKVVLAAATAAAHQAGFTP